MIIHKNLLSIVLLGLGFFSPSIVSASTLTQDGKYSISGFAAQEITEFTGTANSVNLNLGTVIVPSGEISFSLDKTKGNYIYYNFDSGYLTIDVHLFLDAPIADVLGEPPASFNLIESGFLPAFNIVEKSLVPSATQFTYISEGFASQPLLEPQAISTVGAGTLGAPSGEFVTIELASSPINFIGGGVVETGLFTGFEYWNFNSGIPGPVGTVIDIAVTTYEIICSPFNPRRPKWCDYVPPVPPIYPTNTPPPSVGSPPELPPYTDPPLQPVSIRTVPEPTSTLGFLVLGTLGAASTLKRKLKTSKSTKKETTKVG